MKTANGQLVLLLRPNATMKHQRGTLLSRKPQVSNTATSPSIELKSYATSLSSINVTKSEHRTQIIRHVTIKYQRHLDQL